MDKKYYWIKLKTNFFSREDIDFLLSQPNGAEYVVLYQMLCLNTANTDGRLESKIGEIIVPYNSQKIVRDCKYFDVDTVNIAMNLYRQLGLIYQEEKDKTLRILDYKEMIGCETNWAEKKRLYREKKNALNLLGQSEDNKEDIVREEYRVKSIEYRDNNIKEKIYKKEKNINLEIAKNFTNEKNYSSELTEIIKSWITYKNERNEKYKETGLKSLLTQIDNNVKKFGEVAVVEIIRQSMASNYKGIIFDKLKSNIKMQETNKSDRQMEILKGVYDGKIKVN